MASLKRHAAADPGAREFRGLGCLLPGWPASGGRLQPFDLDMDAGRPIPRLRSRGSYRVVDLGDLP